MKSSLRIQVSDIRYRTSIIILQAIRFSFLVLFLFACDIVEAPFMEVPEDGGQTSANPQNVLVLDFTGHTCKSCPKAHQAIGRMEELYGSRLVPIAFHLGYFSKPLLTGKFTTDFRTPEGTLLENYFEFVSFPIGTVQTLDNNLLQPYASWPSLVAEAIKGDSPVKISITPEYLSGLNAVNPEISIIALDNVPGPLSFSVYLTEDSIVDWQKDEDFDPMDIPGYQHNHVFRTSLNGLWGQKVGTNSGFEKGFTYKGRLSKILDAKWNIDNCNLIALVYREDTREIVQVVTVKAK